jgi:hypothetical protein
LVCFSFQFLNECFCDLCNLCDAWFIFFLCLFLSLLDRFASWQQRFAVTKEISQFTCCFLQFPVLLFFLQFCLFYLLIAAWLPAYYVSDLLWFLCAACCIII